MQIYTTTSRDYEDPSIIYDAEAGKWRLATCFNEGGYKVGLLEADDFNGPYTQIGAYNSTSCTGILIQKIGGEYYVFTGRSTKSMGPGAMNLEVLNYPEMTKNTSFKIDGQTDSYNPWCMLFPLQNEEGETVYRLLSFDRDSIMINKDGAMASGQYSYGRIYLWEALQVGGREANVPTAPEVTAQNTATITTAAELWAISKNLDGDYTLGADIDLSGMAWYPIGSEDAPFTGTLNGNGHTITGLTMENTREMDGVGLFGYTGTDAVLTDLQLEEVHVSGRIYTGALVGYNQGTVEGCTVSGTVTGESEVGLLAGRNAGTITGCAVAGTVTGTGNDSTGGLVGANSTGTIQTSMAQGTVSGTINVGGLVGYNDRAAISDCYALSTVTGDNYVGGLVGASGGSGYTMTCSITTSYADCTVEGNTAGGLVGFNDRHITNCFSTGTVSGGIATGGLVGRNNQYGMVSNSYTDAQVAGTSYTGTLFGKNSGDFETVASTSGTAIGNSPFSVLSTAVPDFEAAATYTSGVFQSWSSQIWSTGAGLPVLQGIEAPHVHQFTQEILSDLYLASEATCTKAAEYYYSCTCGKAGTETFSYGDPLPHDFSTTWSADETGHWYECRLCGARNNEGEHSGGEATCSEQAVCSICGTPYGALDQDNHTHTVLENQCNATADHPGYTGDLVCLDCKTVLRYGKVIPQKSSTPITPVEPDEAEQTFVDVAPTDWYAEAVAYVAEQGLMDGVGSGRFNPDGAVTRAMVWTVLARMDGEETDGGSTWYEKARSWAMETGVSDGTNPMASITREQLATMLYRFEGAPAVQGTLNAYPDSDSVSAWAADAMVWATQEEIINGIGGFLKPQNGATRAQLATMLMRR